MSNKHYLGYTVTQLEEAIGKVLNGESDIPEIDLATPTFSLNTNGLVTVTMNQAEGYVSGGTKTFTYQLPTHSGGKYKAGQSIEVKGMFMTGNIEIVALEPTYTIKTISGASYGFSLNSSNYYESENKGVSNSYAICRVQFDLPKETTVYFDCINYAEANYDYGLIGLIDTPLALNYDADTSVTKSFKGSSGSTLVQTVSITIPAGTHFVDVKFIKDSSKNSNDDTLRFKIRFA